MESVSIELFASFAALKRASTTASPARSITAKMDKASVEMLDIAITNTLESVFLNLGSKLNVSGWLTRSGVPITKCTINHGLYMHLVQTHQYNG